MRSAEKRALQVIKFAVVVELFFLNIKRRGRLNNDQPSNAFIKQCRCGDVNSSSSKYVVEIHNKTQINSTNWWSALESLANRIIWEKESKCSQNHSVLCAVCSVHSTRISKSLANPHHIFTVAFFSIVYFLVCILLFRRFFEPNTKYELMNIFITFQMGFYSILYLYMYAFVFLSLVLRSILSKYSLK